MSSARPLQPAAFYYARLCSTAPPTLDEPAMLEPACHPDQEQGPCPGRVREDVRLQTATPQLVERHGAGVAKDVESAGEAVVGVDEPSAPTMAWLIWIVFDGLRGGAAGM